MARWKHRRGEGRENEGREGGRGIVRKEQRMKGEKKENWEEEEREENRIKQGGEGRKERELEGEKGMLGKAREGDGGTEL